MSVSHYQWWLTSLGRTIIWAGLTVLPAGTAQVIDSDGNILAFDSEDTARAALLDAQFVELDGLDDSEAAERGFSLDELKVPSGDTPEALHAQLVQKLASPQ